jgi:hypothetical protein
MRSRKFLVAAVVCGAAAALTTFTLVVGQSPQPAPAVPTKQEPEVKPARDLAQWPYFPKTVYFSGQRGAEWLQRANQLDGRFVHGYVPALNQPLEGDSALRQAGAAYALATAAKYYRSDESAARARQAVLTLLLDTAVETDNLTVRASALPPGLTSRLAHAAVLVQAIHALPAPAADVLDPADQLCNYLRRAQRADGSFAVTEGGPDDADAVNLYSGEAVYALMCSQQQRPAAWKLEAVRKALPYYQARWRGAKNLVTVPRHTAAYTAAFLATKDKAYADFVFEMNDWLCGFQLRQLDPVHPQWVGGFQGCADGKPVAGAPTAASAAYAESLAEACRVAREAGDLQRWQRYKDTLERTLQFLTTLQYTPANCRHFAEWYQPYLVGGFHASHTDGNLRLDYTQQSVCAMVAYLSYAAEVR